VKEKLGTSAADTIGWSNPRLVCIAGDFTAHDVNALEEIGRVSTWSATATLGASC